mgnify:FL=1
MKKLSTNKGLRVAVAGVALVAAGSLALPLAGAAKGGTKGQTSGGTTLVDSPYALTATDAKFGGTVTITAVDKATGAILNPQPENMTTSGTCYAGGVAVATFSKLLANGQTSFMVSASGLANGAACTAYLNIARNGALVPTAIASFNVLP